MNRLWAPWRAVYVTKPRTKGCVLCSLCRSKSDAKNFLVTRSGTCYAVLNRFPYTNGHVMIVPRHHVGSLEGLTDEELLDMMKTAVKIQGALKKTLRPHGFNMGINIGRYAGAGIEDHVHLHIVPRWSGDTNFMPVMTDTRVVSQSLCEVYRRLRSVLPSRLSR